MDGGLFLQKSVICEKAIEGINTLTSFLKRCMIMRIENDKREKGDRMNLFYKLLRQDPESRESIIAMTSGLNIVMNLIVASFKVLVGYLASSIAITSEGINNFSDVATSVLTLLGTKLASKHPDENHPFGYGRIEYLTGLVIAVMILVTGIETLKSAVELIFHPAPLSFSALSIAVVAVSCVIKFVMGVYTIKMGKKAESSALEAVGLDCRNDSFVSIVTIISAFVFIFAHISIDAYVGIFTSLLIIKAGVDVLKDTLSEILGRPGEKELAAALYKEIRRTDGIINAADMMLHNYGPDSYSGSVNIEIDHKKTVGEIYQFIHELQLRIMHEYHVTMVFGIYAVNNDEPFMKEIRKNVSVFVKETEHVKSFHAVYVNTETNTLYCDLIVDYDLRDWDGLRQKFMDYIKPLYPDKEIELVIETEYV